MPEGPEIRRAADRIARAVVGCEAIEVCFSFQHLKPYEKSLQGQRVTAIETRGKAMLMHFESGLSVYAHSQLYGRWYVIQKGKSPRTNRSLRFAIHTHNKSALLYSASEIEVLTTTGIQRHHFLSKLGPDVLAKGLAQATILERLSSPRFKRRRLHALLLDQGFVSGLGNYLRSEILFVAGLHPTCRAGDLSDVQALTLSHCIISVAWQSYRNDGITNNLERVKALKSEGVRRAQYRHHVYGRGGRDCWTCNAEVRQEVLGGRNIFHCPRCQPAPLRSNSPRSRGEAAAP